MSFGFSTIRTRRTGVAGVLRRGGAAAELAVITPLLLLLFVIVLDFGRVFYYSQIIENSAREGALYASDPDAAATSPYANVHDAAVADAASLTPQPTVAETTGTDPDGNDYVRVTVSWPFHLITAFPGVPATKTLTRTVQMRLIPP
jgi:Flp pilus assembly protein TadG